jgi:hypothetical protein
MTQYEYLTVELEWRTILVEGRLTHCLTCGTPSHVQHVRMLVTSQDITYKGIPLLREETPYQDILQGLASRGWRLKESWPITKDGRTLIFERECAAQNPLKGWDDKEIERELAPWPEENNDG